MSVAKVCGVPKGRISFDDRFTALVSANPATVAYLMIQIFNDFSSSITYHLDVDPTYYVEFYDLQNVGQS